MISIDSIGWGKYLDYTGPFFRGNQPYVLPQTPTPEQVYLSVITATEGGNANAINMYDRCGVSVGWIQWCEFGQFSVSALLGAVLSAAPPAVEPVLDLARSQGYGFVLRDGVWRFYEEQTHVIVGDVYKQERLFFLNATGKTGSWDDDSKSHAKKWAATLASVFEDDAAKRVQRDFTTARLDRFVLPSARKLSPKQLPAGVDLNAWAHVAYAAYLSFAANNPSIANAMFNTYVKYHQFLPTNSDWVIGLLKQLTFAPKITIYPGRYNAIRPVLEKHFGVDLPDFAEELQEWHEIGVGIDPSAPPEHRLDTPKAIQQVLLDLGYDLGPAGADGILGPKTKLAISLFQKEYKLQVTGVVDARTRLSLLDAIKQRGG
jgi:hypothetical protein